LSVNNKRPFSIHWAAKLYIPITVPLGTNENFNGKFRDEFLNEYLFHGLKEAKRIIEAWRWDYNYKNTYTTLA